MTPNPSSPADRRPGPGPASRRAGAPPAGRRRLLAALALLPAAAFLAMVLAPPLNHDVAAVLDFALRMRAGEALYRDLIDVNPPLIFLLNQPAAWLAGWLPLEAGQALLLCLLALCGGVLWLCAGLRRGRGEGPVERAVMTALLPLLLVCAGYDFGQREQLMAVAALPYLLLAERRILGLRTPPGAWLATLLLAAAGLALKPHFLAAPALVEALVLLARGRAALRDPFPWAMAALWALYLAAIPAFFPGYFGHVVPLVWDWYVGLGGVPWWRVALTEVLGSGIATTLGLAVLVGLAPRGAGWLPRLAVAAMLGGLAAALVQHKGWSYHLVPVWIWGGLAAGALSGRLADRALAPPRAAGAAPWLAVLAAFGFGLFTLRGGESPWVQLAYPGSAGARIAAWLEREAPGRPLLVLSPDIPTVYPAVVYAGSRLLLPYMSTWLLQAVYQDCPQDGPDPAARYHAPAAMGPAERALFDTVAERLARERPAAVLVARHAGIPWCGGDFDFIAYFSRHPLFAEAWAGYRLRHEIDGYRLYQWEARGRAEGRN